MCVQVCVGRERAHAREECARERASESCVPVHAREMCEGECAREMHGMMGCERDE